MRHRLEVPFLMVIDCALGSRTRVLKESVLGSAEASTHMPVNVSGSGGWPSHVTAPMCRMSRESAAGWKVTSMLTSSLGCRKPSSGLTLKSGAKSPCTLKREGMSPRFCSMRRRVMRELSTAWPKATWSISSCRSIATHAPETTSSGRGRPHTVTTTGSEKGRMRAAGAKRTSSARDSRGRSSPSSAPPPPKERCTDLGASAAAASSSETSMARRERLTSATVRAACW
mmetsp:Transcript_48781/g.117517  ORF Transcript_48781/g.117517 Transcript_48781/m.117517 type:complete len:228 (+) Transcript_48781:1534-2217(+)